MFLITIIIDNDNKYMGCSSSSTVESCQTISIAHIYSIVYDDLTLTERGLSCSLLQVFLEVFPQVQPKLLEECREPKGHAEVSGKHRPSVVLGIDSPGTITRQSAHLLCLPPPL